MGDYAVDLLRRFLHDDRGEAAAYSRDASRHISQATVTMEKAKECQNKADAARERVSSLERAILRLGGSIQDEA